MFEKINDHPIFSQQRIKVISTKTGDTIYENTGLLHILIEGGLIFVRIKENDNTYTQRVIGLNDDMTYLLFNFEKIPL